jgi:hypothetical protein
MLIDTVAWFVILSELNVWAWASPVPYRTEEPYNTVQFLLSCNLVYPGVKILGLERLELFGATRRKIHANLYFMAIDSHPCCSAVTWVTVHLFLRTWYVQRDGWFHLWLSVSDWWLCWVVARLAVTAALWGKKSKDLLYIRTKHTFEILC